MFFEENCKLKPATKELQALYQQKLIEYANEMEYKFIGKADKYLFFIDVSGCPFSCQDIRFISLDTGFDGAMRHVFKDEVNKVPAEILAKFKQEFQKRYGFEWDADMDIEVFGDKVMAHDRSMTFDEWERRKFA